MGLQGSPAGGAVAALRACRLRGHISDFVPVRGRTYAGSSVRPANPISLFLYSVSDPMPAHWFIRLAPWRHGASTCCRPRPRRALSDGAMAVGMGGARLGALTKRMAIAIACITTVSGTAATWATTHPRGKSATRSRSHVPSPNGPLGRVGGLRHRAYTLPRSSDDTVPLPNDPHLRPLLSSSP